MELGLLGPSTSINTSGFVSQNPQENNTVEISIQFDSINSPSFLCTAVLFAP